ncbi:unnamed protein product [Acanthoscelides obtectus]|uniref:Protein yellow n=1 Tax=Acanthoscelides obtectus TaxID=200917 RepID=A0A9P0LC50_ACAOB|nr:unnamed protein product [Acanthoscelides obtectus]CAK1669146.1 Protein yellow [Acanthoscelides obtectus]
MRQTTFALAATVTAALICGASCLVQPQEVFSWKEMEFAWPSKEAMDEAVKSGEYIRENNLPLGIDRWKDKLFVTVPRFRKLLSTTPSLTRSNKNSLKSNKL